MFDQYSLTYLNIWEIQNFENVGKPGGTKLKEHSLNGSRTIFNLDRFEERRIGCWYLDKSLRSRNL